MLEEKIMDDYKIALKNKDTLKSSVLSFLRAELINVAIAKRKKNLDDNEVISVIRKQIKERRDSIEQFKQGMRQDLADKETKELEILSSYLPPELELSSIKRIIEEVITSLDAKEMKQMGMVMKEVMVKISGRAEAKLVSDLVKERLS